MSVPTTRRECRDACSAWIPQPVPRSSTCSRASRTVTCASVVDAPPTPSTWSVRSALPGGQLAQVGRDPPVDLPAPVDGGVRAQVDAGADVVAVDLDQAEPRGARPRSSVGSARSSVRARRRRPEQERADQRRDDVVGSRCGRAQRRHGLLAVQRVGGDRPEHLLDAGDAVPGRRQVVAERRDERRHRAGARRARSHEPRSHHPRPASGTLRHRIPPGRPHFGRQDARSCGRPAHAPDVRSFGRHDARVCGRRGHGQRVRSTTSGRWSLARRTAGPSRTRGAENASGPASTRIGVDALRAARPPGTSGRRSAPCRRARRVSRAHAGPSGGSLRSPSTTVRVGRDVLAQDVGQVRGALVADQREVHDDEPDAVDGRDRHAAAGGAGPATTAAPRRVGHRAGPARPAARWSARRGR